MFVCSRSEQDQVPWRHFRDTNCQGILMFCSSQKWGCFWGHLFAARCALGWLVGVVQNLPTNLCFAGHTDKRGLYRINQYKPRTDANLLYQPRPHILLRQSPCLPTRVGAAGKKQWGALRVLPAVEPPDTAECRQSTIYHWHHCHQSQY